MKTPVLLLLFKRPEETRHILQSLRQVKPEILLVSTDGPRVDNYDDIKKCAAVRDVINEVDWNCTVLKNYSDTNLGCGIAPYQGISWAFDQVGEAIILEDDCLPDTTFFRFCEELLEKYRDNERVMHISGNNYSASTWRSAYSYSFSRYPLGWGWATWRRAWKHFDFEMKYWPEVRDKNLLKDILASKETIYDWEKTFQFVYDGHLDCWDFQWLFTCWVQNGLSIIPRLNLVTNVGSGQDATHFQENSPLLNLPVQSLEFPLKHPPFLIRDSRMDEVIQTTVYNYNLTPYKNVIRKLKKIRQRFFL